MEWQKPFIYNLVTQYISTVNPLKKYSIIFPIQSFSNLLNYNLATTETPPGIHVALVGNHYLTTLDFKCTSTKSNIIKI